MDIESDFVHLVGFTVDGKLEDATALARKTLRTIIRQRPDLADQAKALAPRMKAAETTRNVSSHALPVDVDSRLELLRREDTPRIEVEPTWPDSVLVELDATVAERTRERELRQAGLMPTRSLLFVGPPGVGKTLAARWLARELKRPLLTLDLAAVMSSYLGRTGNNIRAVLDYARKTPSVLLLDEFDAIAKRRDDLAEIGELKRLVTVLLQQVDEWPAGQLLIAATNHPELLDTAVWRRFDRVVRFPQPSRDEILAAMQLLLADDPENSHDAEEVLPMLALLLQGQSFSEVVRRVTIARRHAIVHELPLSDALTAQAQHCSRHSTREQRLAFATALENLGYSQRKAAEMAGVARDTLRRRNAARRPKSASTTPELEDGNGS